MKRVAIATLIAVGATSGAAFAEPPIILPTLATAGAATPSVGANITNVPTLFDTELATIRANLVSTKVNATLSVAPFLTPKLFGRWWSETRLGFLAEDAGSFAFGAAWGYSQARAHLASNPLTQARAVELKLEPIDNALLAAAVALCDRIRKCQADVPRATNCVLWSDLADADDPSEVCSSFNDPKAPTLGTNSRKVAERVLYSAPAAPPRTT